VQYAGLTSNLFRKFAKVDEYQTYGRSLPGGVGHEQKIAGTCHEADFFDQCLPGSSN